MMASATTLSQRSDKTRLDKKFSELGLPPDFAAELVGHSTLVHYSRGEMLFLEGSPTDVLFYVLKGFIKVYAPGPDDTRVMVKLAGPGDLLGFSDWLDPRGRRVQAFEAQALTKGSVALLTRGHFRNLLQALDIPTLINVIEGINSAWSSFARRFVTLLGLSFRERLELVLAQFADRFGVQDSRGTLITPELAHEDLADMIGSSRPMVSRLFADMLEEGVLLRQGRQIIVAGSLRDKTDSAECRARD